MCNVSCFDKKNKISKNRSKAEKWGYISCIVGKYDEVILNERKMKIINKCAEKNIQLWVKDGKLHFKSPQGAFGDELKQEVKANKEK